MIPEMSFDEWAEEFQLNNGRLPTAPERPPQVVCVGCGDSLFVPSQEYEAVDHRCKQEGWLVAGSQAKYAVYCPSCRVDLPSGCLTGNCEE